MKSTPLDLAQMSELRYRVTLFCQEEQDLRIEVIAVAFSGVYGYGSLGDGDGRFMAAMISAMLTAYEPAGLVLDLRDLEYQFGNTIQMALSPAPNDDDESTLPTALVVSDKCQAGLASLTEGLRKDWPNWTFTELDEAVQYAYAAALLD